MRIEKILFLFVCQLLLTVYISKVTAQTIQYSSQNINSNYPDNVQLVSGIAGNHHLICFTSKEYPEIFVFNQELKCLAKIKLPFKFPERSDYRIIPFADFYYISVYSRISQEYLFWKVDGHGNLSDLTPSFRKLLQSQLHNLKRSFQLIANQQELWMTYHTSLSDPEKSTLVVVQTDTLLNVVFTNKIMYDFKSEEEQLKQQVILFGKYLYVLKTARSNTILELMKVNLATGYTNTQIFESSGYIYSQSTFKYNIADSAVIVSSLLKEPRIAGLPKQVVFLGRLNATLHEQVPLAILKSQFIKNTSTNFLLVEGFSKWIRLRNQSLMSYMDFGIPDPGNPAVTNAFRDSYSIGSDNGIRFSLLNDNLEIISDSLVVNNKNSYTLNANAFTSFISGSKEYLLLGQQFSKRSRGLLMINTDDRHKLVYTDVRVNARNNYLLSQSRIIPGKGIIIPYTNRKEAGLIKITVE